MNPLRSLATNVWQISEGTNSVDIVRWDLGFCSSAVIGMCFLRRNY